MNLVVKLAEGSNGGHYVAVPEGVDAREHLEAFLQRRWPFDGDWVELTSGEWVRYSFIVSVRLPTDTGTPHGIRKKP